MTSHIPISNIDLWRTRLGLFPVPLFNDQQVEPRFILLNGNQGNFCLDLSDVISEVDPRDSAWSSNVGHYVTQIGDHIEVQRWDRQRSSLERYTLSSVYNNLEKFHEYLESNSPGHESSVIAHTIGVFRRLRATLGDKFSGTQSLEAFLYLLACLTDNKERGTLNSEAWNLGASAPEVAFSIRGGDWNELMNQFAGGRPVERLTPNINLLLRHASGQLFQEASYEALFIPQNQLRFEGFLPAPVKAIKENGGIGAHFTPAALARTLVEEGFSRIGIDKESLFVFDPACGSGEFLREALRQLKLLNFKGHIKILGWDISKTACDMAKFILAWELRDISTIVDVEIKHTDSLDPDLVWPEDVDIVLMNPPFVAWQDIPKDQQLGLTKVLGNFNIQRPNLSYAFLLKASLALKNNGILGTILPASFLNGTSASKLREYLGTQMAPKLLARLGSHTIFYNAIIDPALYIAQKSTNSEEPVIAFWADHRPNSSSIGLRTLRKIRNSGSGSSLPINEEGFSIYPDYSLGREKSDWAPRRYSSWVTLRSLNELPKVKELFNIYQGIRTGDNSTFLLDLKRWEDIPANERVFFRPAVINKSIKYGYLQNIAFVFYPYTDCRILSEAELNEKLPYYYNNYLLPAKSRLVSRPGLTGSAWWELTRHRSWQEIPESKIVSTYFGDAGSFAWDDEGTYVVLQGFGWLPKKPTRNKSHLRKISLAYLAILNSQLFSELLSAVSNNVSGGQWDLSKRYVDNISIPDLYSERPTSATTQKLFEIGNLIFLGSHVEEEELDLYVKRAYGLS